MRPKGILGIVFLLGGMIIQGLGILFTVKDTTEQQLEPVLKEIEDELNS